MPTPSPGDTQVYLDPGQFQWVMGGIEIIAVLLGAVIAITVVVAALIFFRKFP